MKFMKIKNNLKVYEGERQIASKNNLLGEFSIKMEKMGMAGTVKVKICMEIDENGLLHLHYKHNVRKNLFSKFVLYHMLKRVQIYFMCP